MQTKNTQAFATADLKILGKLLVDPKLSADERKMVVISIASEPSGVSLRGAKSTAELSAVNEKAIELLDRRDLSPRSIKVLAEVIERLPLGYSPSNVADVQSMNFLRTAKYFKLHVDDFLFTNNISSEEGTD